MKSLYPFIKLDGIYENEIKEILKNMYLNDINENKTLELIYDKIRVSEKAKLMEFT